MVARPAFPRSGRITGPSRGAPPGEEAPSAIRATEPRTTLKFLMVDELERLVLVIFEKSPNLTFKD